MHPPARNVGERRLAPMRIQQVKHFFLADRRGHRDAGLFDFRKTRAQRPRPRDHAGNAEADVVGAFVAQHLRRHAGHDGAFHGGRAVGIDELPDSVVRKPAVAGPKPTQTMSTSMRWRSI